MKFAAEDAEGERAGRVRDRQVDVVAVGGRSHRSAPRPGKIDAGALQVASAPSRSPVSVPAAVPVVVNRPLLPFCWHVGEAEARAELRARSRR